jgi:hypothetical protein
LRRQAGASDVTLDSVEGFALLTLGSPATIDFKQLVENVEGAAYTTTTVQLRAQGALVQAECATCGSEVSTLELAQTQQRICVLGETNFRAGPFHGHVTEWASDHPRISVDAGK